MDCKELCSSNISRANTPYVPYIMQAPYCMCCEYVHYTHYSTRMSPDNTHKLMGFYMEVLILGIIL